jgi:hypothetical protein
LLLAIAGWPAAAEVRPDVTAEALVGGGVDTNIFLQVAASPDSPTWHPAGGLAFGRLAPSIIGTLTGQRLRLSLEVEADLRLAESSGLLAQEEGTLTLSALELGPASAFLAARVSRYDNSRYPSDRFLSLGGQTGATIRLGRAWRAAAHYRLDRREFGDPATVEVDHDWTHAAEARLDYLPRQGLVFGVAADYLTLRSTAADPDLEGGRLDRVQLELSATVSTAGRLALLGAVWGGLQHYPGLDSDRQVGGTAAVLYRLFPGVSAIARYDLVVSRATDPDLSSYDRQVALIGLLGRIATARGGGATASLGAEPRPEPRGSQVPVIAGAEVRFRLRAPGAASVVVIGSWNDWEETAEQRLAATREPGLWEGSVTTGPGQHRYRFLIDGRAVRPPDALRYRPDGFGGEDGVVDVP